MDPAAPAALVQNGGTARQRSLCGTLEEVAHGGPDRRGEGPTLVLVGEAVARGTRPLETLALAMA